ncbi:MAG: 3-hydroxybutyryl-CoA dehydrogenase, partial [Pirellulales bacterium]|nr:3-hydroxybutyryl-CoA dehydrogenase [Pirellulales bacterium]
MADDSKNSVETVGLLGLGLMGRGIAACLLCHGLKVIAYNRTRGRAETAREFIAGVMKEVVRRGVFPPEAVADWAERFTVVEAVSGLAGCPFVLESVKEDLELKRQLYAELEKHVAPDAVIASNTSSFPLTLLQAR